MNNKGIILNTIILMEQKLLDDINITLYSVKNDEMYEYYFDIYSDIQDLIRDMYNYKNSNNIGNIEYNIKDLIKLCKKI